jgi:hypothetical protein
MWIDDCVHIVVAEAMVLNDILNEQEKEKPSC